MGDFLACKILYAQEKNPILYKVREHITQRGQIPNFDAGKTYKANLKINFIVMKIHFSVLNVKEVRTQRENNCEY